MDATALKALESLIGTWPVGVAFVLVLSALIWVTKSLLSSKDRELIEKNNTIDILRKAFDSDREKMFWFITTLSLSLEKHTAFLEKHDAEAIRHRERILTEIDNFKRDFSSLPCKLKWVK